MAYLRHFILIPHSRNNLQRAARTLWPSQHLSTHPTVEEEIWMELKTIRLSELSYAQKASTAGWPSNADPSFYFLHMCIYMEVSVSRGHGTRKRPKRWKEEALREGEGNRTHGIRM